MLFTEPEPIEAVAQAPDGPPALVRIPRWHETSVKVRECFGPERIAWEWWKPEVPESPSHGTRDYYVIEDEEGRWSWVYRHLETGKWYVQGEWA